MLSCERAQGILAGSEDDDLADAEARELTGHLEGCRPCRDALATAEGAVERLATWVGVDVEPMAVAPSAWPALAPSAWVLVGAATVPAALVPPAPPPTSLGPAIPMARSLAPTGRLASRSGLLVLFAAAAALLLTWLLIARSETRRPPADATADKRNRSDAKGPGETLIMDPARVSGGPGSDGPTPPK